jgi:quercetin dioxygenase-like cupin family protein
VFENEYFTQRVVELDGPGGHDSSDEVLYVLEGEGRIEIGGEEHELRPGVAIFASRGTRWTASGARAVSVLVHDPEPSSGHAVLDLAAAERGSATAGRQFVLGATPEVGCASVTQFIGLVPPGRAPDHFHTYDEVITILDGEGVFHTADGETQLEPGSVVLLPARQVHCLENTGDSELRLLGVFRPAGSPAEAYYPDGTPAVQPERT